MKLSILALALVSCAVAAPAQAHGDRRQSAYVVAYEGWQPGFKGTRSHRTAWEDGYFSHGEVGRGGRFDYDRSYPYDNYFAYDRTAEDEDLVYAEAEEPLPSGRGCERQWVRDGRGGKAEVRVCRD